MKRLSTIFKWRVLNLNALFLLISFSFSYGKDNNLQKLNLISIPREGGQVSGAGNYKDGQEIELFAEAQEGFSFKEWRDSDGRTLSLTANFAFVMNGSQVLFALFEKSDRAPGEDETETSGGVDEANILISKEEMSNLRIFPDYGLNVPKNELVVATRYLGDAFVEEGIAYDHSGAVANQNRVDMVINTWDLRKRGIYRMIRGGGPHIWLFKDFSEDFFPWREVDDELVLELTASVPVVDLADGSGQKAHFGFSADQAPVTQLSFGFYLRDVIAGQTFAYIIEVYESRGKQPESSRSNDTQVNFVSTQLRNGTKYVTMDDQSESLQFEPYSEMKHFKVILNRENLLRAIQNSGGNLPEEVSQFKITMAGILFELPNYVEDGNNVSKVQLSEFSVYIQKKK